MESVDFIAFYIGLQVCISHHKVGYGRLMMDQCVSALGIVPFTWHGPY